MTKLPCERLLIIACGSVNPTALATYLAQLRQKVASEIRLVATPSAGSFLDEEQLWPAMSCLVTSLRDDTDCMAVPHLRLGRWAQTLVVLPATADILGKAADGIADDLAATLLLVAPRPVVFAPAMNEEVWLAPAVRRKVGRLREGGHYVIEPVAGASLLAASQQDSGRVIGPTVDLVLTHTMHVVLKQLRESTAVRERILDDR